jgi:hypothetical protein
MKNSARYFLAILVIGLGVALWATGPGASSKHFVLVNDNDNTGRNFGTELKLLGNRADFSLESKAKFATGGFSDVGPWYTPSIQMIHHGPDICVFLGGGKGMDIASFLYPSLAKVGNYTDSEVTDAWYGIVLAANGNYLFAAYNGQGSQDAKIGVWRIKRGCTLSLINTYTPPYIAFSMAVAPNGQTLVISYETDFEVGSYGIGPGGVLIGPYTAYLNGNGYAAEGLDITADSKFAIFETQGDYSASVDIFVINADGSLGNDYEFDSGNASLAGYPRLSPDQKFLFVNDDSEHVTTLNFTEAPINLTYTGCTTKLRVPRDEPSVAAFGMATELPSGDGGTLYVAEQGNFSHIGILAVNASTGCLTEAASSPFQLTDNNARVGSVAAWPPRPF